MNCYWGDNMDEWISRRGYNRDVENCDNCALYFSFQGKICKMAFLTLSKLSCLQTDFSPIIALFPKYPVVVAVEQSFWRYVKRKCRKLQDGGGEGDQMNYNNLCVLTIMSDGKPGPNKKEPNEIKEFTWHSRYLNITLVRRRQHTNCSFSLDF